MLWNAALNGNIYLITFSPYRPTTLYDAGHDQGCKLCVNVYVKKMGQHEWVYTLVRECISVYNIPVY